MVEMTVRTWGDGYEGSGVETQLKWEDGSTMSVEFSDGESEDMYIARDLSDAEKIWQLIQAAYQAGIDGQELKIVHVQDEDDDN